MENAKKKTPLEVGKCPGCDTDIITTDPGKERRLKNYRETIFELDDGKYMRVALCDACLESLDDKLADRMMERFRVTWNQEIEESNMIPENEKGDAIDRMKRRKLRAFGLKQHDIVSKRRNRKSLRAEMHRQKMEELHKENQQLERSAKAMESEKRQKKNDDHQELLRAERERIEKEELKRAAKSLM